MLFRSEIGVPLVSTFHTLARVKAEGGDPEPERRERAEASIIGCADAICVSCDEEEDQFRRLYGDPPGVMEIVAPGVEHAFFTPGDRRGARRALGMGSGPVLLFVGRIQPLKGVDVAVRALAALGRPDAALYVVGGSSGLGGDAYVESVHTLVAELGLERQVHFVAPQPHHILSTYYRAADAVWVPILDARRAQVFSGFYRSADGDAQLTAPETVSALRVVLEQCRTMDAQHFRFCSPDLAPFTETLSAAEIAGANSIAVPRVLAGTLARMGLRSIGRGGAVSAVAVDANYIRASDAELFWKG